MVRELAAKCGINCGECSYKDKFGCPGCQKANGKIFWGECRLAKCVIDKGLNYCYECDDFVCDLLKEFAFDKEQGDNGKRIENLKQWKKNGFDCR